MAKDVNILEPCSPVVSTKNLFLVCVKKALLYSTLPFFLDKLVFVMAFINNLFLMIQEILSKENITVNILESSNSEHYKTTPYIFSPKFGKKLNPDNYIDLGQGLTQMAEKIYQQINNGKK